MWHVIYLYVSQGFKLAYLGRLVLLCTCGFHLKKSIFFFEQIKNFQGIVGVYLDEEGFQKEGIHPQAVKLILPLIWGEISN